MRALALILIAILLVAVVDELHMLRLDYEFQHGMRNSNRD
jgi:hypothetical protein